MCTDRLPCSSKLTTTFYQQHNYTPVWIDGNEPSDNALDLVDVLRAAYLDGLDPRNYHIKQINTLLNAIDDQDNNDQHLSRLLVNLDVTLTDAFFLYAHDLNMGLIDVKKMYPYWSPIKKAPNLIAALNSSITNKDVIAELADLTPKYSGYRKLKHKLVEYRAVAENGGWPTIPDGDDLELGSKGDRVALLQQRLLINGELSEISGEGKFNKDLEQAVIQYQENNGLYDDGIVESDTLRALNVSAKTRIRQIELNMDKMRLLPDDLGKEYLMINLPEYSLNLIKNHKAVLTMDVAVGGAEHPSCVLNSKVTYLVLNPYWYVPTSIAAKEFLPAMQNDPTYFSRKNVQMLKRVAKDDYKVINPDSINWNKMTEREMNKYRFQQLPGEGNALGRVKFMFQNACQMYLHDSNESELFDVYKRDFSHGCVRVSEPVNLTNYILGVEKGLSSDEVSDMLDKDRNKTISFPNPINIYFVYFTAWVDNNDWVQFRNDVYHFDNLANYSVYLTKKPPETKSEASSAE